MNLSYKHNYKYPCVLSLKEDLPLFAANNSTLLLIKFRAHRVNIQDMPNYKRDGVPFGNLSHIIQNIRQSKKKR